MVPSFLLGVFVFVFILLMFQFLRLTEYVVVHGVEFSTVAKMMGYMSISFLPIILPMTFIFSVLLTYSRLSNDSEIIAFKALGLNVFHLSIPALMLAAISTLISLQTSFNIAPWGNREFEKIVNHLKNMKASVTIKSGIFSEGFFDLVVYSNEVDSKTGKLKKVFIYDERSSSPLTIIAKEGQLIKDKFQPHKKSLLRLKDGNIHKTNDVSYTKIDFDTYDINLFEDSSNDYKNKTALSYSSAELKEIIKRSDTKNFNKKKLLNFTTEYYRRWALGLASFVFALVCIGLGIQTNKRTARSGGIVLALFVVIAYWVVYISFEGLAKGGTLPIWIAVWLPNCMFASFGSYQIVKNYKT